VPGDSEHHSPILLALNEDDGRAKTEDEYSPTVMAPSFLATVQCGLSVNRNFDEEFPVTQGPILMAMLWRPFPSVCR
jgi:hypothetical protein